ncbi:hypothetical protein ILYODFUR_014735 [Ilyodon furcidens]|uniref:Uncharacterized protein n=1 Tax=Ilyodon furcidens TaxID=33524 RepID=A0ABV0VFL7_9TELE
MAQTPPFSANDMSKAILVCQDIRELEDNWSVTPTITSLVMFALMQSTFLLGVIQKNIDSNPLTTGLANLYSSGTPRGRAGVVKSCGLAEEQAIHTVMLVLLA